MSELKSHHGPFYKMNDNSLFGQAWGTIIRADKAEGWSNGTKEWGKKPDILWERPLSALWSARKSNNIFIYWKYNSFIDLEHRNIGLTLKCLKPFKLLYIIHSQVRHWLIYNETMFFWFCYIFYLSSCHRIFFATA